MVLMNYLELQNGIPVRIHATDHYYMDRMIFDRELQKEKPVRSLILQLDQVDGEPSIKTFSVLSSKLYSLIAPYLPNSAFRDYEFIITKTGSGFVTNFTVEAIPLPPAPEG